MPGDSPEIEHRVPVVSQVLPPGTAVAMYFDTDNPPVPFSQDTIALVSPKLTAVARGAAGSEAVTWPPEVAASPEPNEFVATMENE